MKQAMEAFDITENLPNPSDQEIFPEIMGLAVTMGFRCIHCHKILGTVRSIDKHHHESHPDQPIPKEWPQCHTQQLHPHFARTIFQVRPCHIPGPILVDDMIESLC
jgi:hypothetical protein